MTTLLKIIGIREETDCLNYEYAMNKGRNIEELDYCRNCDKDRAKQCLNYRGPERK
jgi:hypothetical protein